jgi:hypothetical protein
LLGQAAQEGALRSDVDLDMLQQDLGFAFASAMLAWVMGALAVEELEPAIGHAYALALSAAAEPSRSPAIYKRALEYQKRLRQSRRRAGAA